MENLGKVEFEKNSQSRTDKRSQLLKKREILKK